MAAAGIVTTDSSEFLAMVETAPETVREAAVAARALIVAVDPNAVEVVWPTQRTAGYGIGPKKMTEQYIWLAPHSKHLVFGFYSATELPDPANLLEGTGRLMRHVKVRSAETVDRPELRELVEAAVAHLRARP